MSRRKLSNFLLTLITHCSECSEHIILFHSQSIIISSSLIGKATFQLQFSIFDHVVHSNHPLCLGGLFVASHHACHQHQQEHWQETGWDTRPSIPWKYPRRSVSLYPSLCLPLHKSSHALDHHLHWPFFPNVPLTALFLCHTENKIWKNPFQWYLPKWNITWQRRS